MGRLRALVVASLAAALLASGITVAPLAVPAANATSRELAIQQILADTNAIRAELGLRPLIRNSALDGVAQTWTQSLANRGALSHNTRLRSQIPSTSYAGENVAGGYTYRTVVAAWKKSSGHYANLINSRYTDIGIGYAEKNGTAFFTQDFARYSHSTPAGPVPSPTPWSAPTPRVSGNKIVDARTDRPWTPRAVNWPSFEYACQQGWAYAQDGATDEAAAAMVEWGINAVRLPLNEQCWLGVEGNPDYGSAGGYRAAVRGFVDILNSHGLVVILDLHWSAPVGQQADGQRAMTSSRSVLFWQSVAKAYSKVPAVMFDAFNEPYSRDSFTLGWTCWKSGGCQAPVSNDESPMGSSTFTVVGMSTLVKTIRKAGAKQPILLAGIDYANDLRGWLANRPSDSQLIASWHNYPGQRCDDVACWNAEIAPVAAKVPVIMTETGWTDPAVDHLSPALEWADTERIGYAPWAWWVVDGSDPDSAGLYALIDDDGFTPKFPAGTTYLAHLQSLPAPATPKAPSRTDTGDSPPRTPVVTSGSGTR